MILNVRPVALAVLLLAAAPSAAAGYSDPSGSTEATRPYPVVVPQTRAPSPLRIATPEIFYLGNLPWGCSLGRDACLDAMKRRLLQVEFAWSACKSPSCAPGFTHFEIYKVPHGGKSQIIRTTTTVADNGLRANLSGDEASVPIPPDNATLPPTFVRVATGGSSASTTFLSNFAIGDCFAVRVQSAQGFYSQLSSGLCVDRATPLGISERDVLPSDRPVTVDHGPGVCSSSTNGLDTLTYADAPFIGVEPGRNCVHGAIVTFRVPTPIRPMWLLRGTLVADGNARCAFSLGQANLPLRPNFETIGRIDRAGSALNDDITSWLDDRVGDLAIRIFAVSKGCYERLDNFRVHLIAPARNTGREPTPGFTLPSWFGR